MQDTLEPGMYAERVANDRPKGYSSTADLDATNTDAMYFMTGMSLVVDCSVR